jgi:chemosensory pili system protein ChpA (sensor histidine kinase/response regulator)
VTLGRFSLDDIRDSFAEDVGGFAARIREAARLIADALPADAEPDAVPDTLPAAAGDSFSQEVAPPIPTFPDGTPALQAVSESAHSLFGVAALVGVGSLTDAARLVEGLARRAGASPGRRTEAAVRLAEAADALGEMLTLELQHRSDEASALAAQLRQRAAGWDIPPFDPSELEPHQPAPPPPAPDPVALAAAAAAEAERIEAALASGDSVSDMPALGGTDEGFHFPESDPPAAVADARPAARAPAAPPPESDGGFSFVDEGAGGASAGPATTGTGEGAFAFSNPAAADAELLEVFRLEARENLVALQGHLRTLAARPDDAESATALERIYHTLKGAAAAVGLAEVASMAGALEDTFEAVAAGDRPADAALLDGVLVRTNELLDCCGLPPLSPPAGAAAPDADRAGAELRDIFLTEAADILRQLDALLDEGSPDPDDPDGAEQAAVLLHRLKGSATVCARPDVSELAEALRIACRSGGPADTRAAELRAGAARLRGMLELPDEPAAGAPRPAPAPSPAPGVATAPESQPTADAAAGVVREAVALDVDPDLLEVAEAECVELLDRIDKAILGLEDSPQPRDVLADLFRDYHTLKGAVNTIGLAPVGRTLHRVEDLMEHLRGAAILPPMSRLSRLLLGVQDELRANLRQARSGYVETRPGRLAAGIAALSGGAGAGGAGTASATAPGAGPGTASASGSMAGSSPSLGESAAAPDSGPSRPRTAAGSGPASTGAAAAGPDRKSIRVSAERLDSLMNLTGELVVGRARMQRKIEGVAQLMAELEADRRRLTGAVEGFRGRYEFSRAAPAPAGPAFATPEDPDAGLPAAGPAAVFGALELDTYDDVNILARRLAEIANDISEIQTQLAGALGQFREEFDAFGRTLSGLQGELTRSRMAPVEQLFDRLRRPVSDAADRLGRQVRVSVSGEEVALDRTILDELYLPMLHLVRNSVAHGIEPADARRAAGKDPVGTVLLTAVQEAGQVVIEVADDGRGLDLARLTDKAVALGYLAPGEVPAPGMIEDLIFESGMSTSAKAGDVSGRGMGMDIVRREIQKLGGRIRVRTVAGRGVTFTIHMPLTLAVRRVLLVEQGGEVFAAPLHFAGRVVTLAEARVDTTAGVRRIEIDGRWLPLAALSGLLDGAGDADFRRGSAVVLRLGDQAAALRVDRVLGQEEIVVKKLGDLLDGHPLLAGATFSGDGDVILILDVPGLLDRAAGRSASAAPSPGTASAAPAPRRADQPVAPAAPAGRLRVLFVDDSLSVRRVAEKFLRGAGCEITLAVDGRDGQEKLRAGAFDLVFTDLEMPRLNGYEFLREIRRVPAYRDLPVVLVTSRSGDKHREQARLAGATDYVTKPFTAEILEAKLKLWTGRRAAGARREADA